MTVIPLQDPVLSEKMETVRVLLEGKRVLVAFSGGVDSSVLLLLAKIFVVRLLLLLWIRLSFPWARLKKQEFLLKI